MAAGPWFTVRHSDDDWELLDTIWMSNKTKHNKARFEIKTRLLSAEEIDNLERSKIMALEGAP